MATGYSAIGKCFATEAEAIDAYYSTQQASITQFMSGNNNFFIYTHFKANGVWYENSTMWHYATGPGQGYSRPAINPGVGNCDYVAPSSGNASTTIDTGLPADFDYSILGAVFAFAVSVVVAMYVLGRGAGVVLSIFRK